MSQTDWNKEKVINEIQERSTDGVAPSCQEAWNLYQAGAKHFDSWKTACAEAGVMTRDEARRWTKEQVLKEIKQKSTDGTAPSTEEEPVLENQARMKFDSWKNACQEAGVTPRMEEIRWSRDELIAQLQQEADEGVAPPSTEVSYINPLRNAFGSYENACQQAGLEPRKKREWTREELIEQLQNDAEDGIAPSSTDVSYVDAAARIFGSWETACEQAGLKPHVTTQKKWTRERIVKQLEEDSEDGFAPSTADVPYHEPARREFGDWESACIAAGVSMRSEKGDGEPFEPATKYWTRQRVIDRIQQIARDGYAAANDDHGVKTAARRYFDSWKDACESAGVKPASQKPSSYKWDKESILEKLKEHAEEGIAPSAHEMSNFRKHVRRAFGSWEEACEQAGLTSRQSLNQWSRSEVIDYLQEQSDGEYAPPRGGEGTKPAIRLFGSWKAACEAAGLKPAGERNHFHGTNEELLDMLRNDSRNGVAPATKDVSYYNALKSRFGSWDAACEAAGVTPKSEARGVQSWSKEKVISEIQRHATEGNAPSTENHSNLYQAARRYFSSWTDACHAAGVKPASEA